MPQRRPGGVHPAAAPGHPGAGLALGALIPLAAAGSRALPHVAAAAPPNTRCAQIVDHRLALADTLSTAFFSQAANGRARAGSVRQWQYRRRSESAGRWMCARRFRYRVPRAAYAVGSAAAGGVQPVRAALRAQPPLDLRPPLARILHQSLGGVDPCARHRPKKNAPRSRPPLTDQLGVALRPGRAASATGPGEATTRSTVGNPRRRQLQGGTSSTGPRRARRASRSRATRRARKTGRPRAARIGRRPAGSGRAEGRPNRRPTSSPARPTTTASCRSSKRRCRT